MKAILEFNLSEPAEEKEHRRAISATDAYLVLLGMDDYFRYRLKYEGLDGAELQAIVTSRQKLNQLLAEYNINMNDLE